MADDWPNQASLLPNDIKDIKDGNSFGVGSIISLYLFVAVTRAYFSKKKTSSNVRLDDKLHEINK